MGLFRAVRGLTQATPRPGSFLDRIYRMDETGSRWLYTSKEAPFGEIDPADVDQPAERLWDLEEAGET